MENTDPVPSSTRLFFSFSMPFQLLHIPGHHTMTLPVGVYEVAYEGVKLYGMDSEQPWLLLKGMDIGIPKGMLQIFLHPGKHSVQDQNGPIDTSPWQAKLVELDEAGIREEVERLRSAAEEQALAAGIARYTGELATPDYLKAAALYADMAAYLAPATPLGSFARRAAIFWAVQSGQRDYLDGLLERFSLIPNLDEGQRQSWLKIVALRNR